MTRRCLLFLVVALYAVTAQDRCFTPQNKVGTCINVYKCTPLINAVKKQQPLTAETIELLRRLQCGYEGMNAKVCCEQQAPPVTVTEAPIQTTAVPDPPDVSNHPNLRLLNDNICGPVTQQKIFGGNKTGVFDFPWMALLAYRNNAGKTEYKCGGSLINKRYVLTAAHCFLSPLPGGFAVSGVRLGEHDLSTERDCDREADGDEIVCTAGYQDFGLDRIHIHPEYSRETHRNDIALLRLNADANLGPANVKPVCLPIDASARLTQKKATATGWGATEYGPRSQDLLQVQLPIVNNTACMEPYRKLIQIWHKQLCAGGRREMDSCNGDSGGPLQAPGLYKNNVRYIQYGIVSFGMKNCGTAGIPGVYTNIPYYLDWILSTISE